MAPGTGPFAQSWRLYQQAGWLGTLPLPKLRKSDPPYGFSGRNHAGVWPDSDQCHNWSHQNGSNIGIRLSEDTIAIDVDHGYKALGAIKEGAIQLAAREAVWGPLPPTWVSTSRRDDPGCEESGKRFYRLPEDLVGSYWPGSIDRDIEVLQHGHRYAVVWPSRVADKIDPSIIRQERWYRPDGFLSQRPPTLDELPYLPKSWADGLRALASEHGDVPLTRADFPEPVKLPEDIDPKAPWYRKVLSKPDATNRGNNASISVAGGVAKDFHQLGLPFEAALAVVLNYERASSFPQPDQVIIDQMTYTWAKESAKARAKNQAEKPEGQAATDFLEERGWLAERGDGIVGYDTQINGQKDKKEVVPFSDFQVKATSVHSNEGKTTWTLDLIRAGGEIVQDVELTGDVLASSSRLRSWAAGYRCSLVFTGDRDQRGPAGVRLQQLMLSQRPDDRRVISYLGWDDMAQGFVTYEGVITADAIRKNAPVRASNDLRKSKLVDHHYGFDRGEVAARAALNEVLTFHDEMFVSVHASWMAACVMKGQILNRAGMFPIFLAQAASESGKTQGYTEMIRQLFGDLPKKGGTGSRAAVRDALTAHRGSPVYLDDPDDVDEIKEMMRQVPVEGNLDKKGDDKNVTIRSTMRSPLWVSMEGSSLLADKAMNDRIIAVTLPNPRNRMSLRVPGQRQFEDIMDFRNQHDEQGLTVYAGSIVQMVLRAGQRRMAEFKEIRTSAGRHGDKLAIIRLGARILSDVTGDESHIRRVDAWASEQVDRGEENALTMELLPAALQFWGVVERPYRHPSPPYYGLPSPVVVTASGDGTENALWVELGKLAAWWDKHKGGRVSERVHTKDALEEQAKRLDMRGGRGDRNIDFKRIQISVSGEKAERAYYWRVPDEIAARLLDGYVTADEGVST